MRTINTFTLGISRLLSLFVLLGSGAVVADSSASGARLKARSAAEDAALQFFESKVRPVLVDNCATCHGPKKQMAGVRLDSREALLKGGESGPVVVPGDPLKSSLIQVISYGGKIQMPPAGKLESEEIEAITKWVKMGAPWPTPRQPATSSPTTPEARTKWWSLQPVQRPKVPPLQSSSWAKSPFDAFIAAELKKKGLAPAAAADRRTLIRRATFDLTGLPPTPEDVRAFVTDTDPKAYENLVNRLLASPAYGERWGRHWLDVARYTDSLDARGLGGEGDLAEAWRYRDWVVDAFNRDLPYNQFIMQQVAGDILANSPPNSGSNGDNFDASKVVATGLLAIGNWGNGDADKEKVLTDIADDQVDIVSRGFMGLTVACARCHDHKFDPISTRDYYAMAGIFFSSRILPKMAAKGAGENPLRIPLASSAQMERLQQHVAKLADAETQLTTTTQKYFEAFARDMKPQAARYLMAIYDYQNRPAGQANLSIDQFADQHGLHAYALRQWMSYIGLGDYRLMATPLRDLLGSMGVYGFKGSDDTPSLVVNTNTDARTLLTFTLPPKSVSIHPGPANGVAISWKSPITGVVKIRGSVVDVDSGGGDGIAWAIQHRKNLMPVEVASGDIPNGGSQKFPEAASSSSRSAISVVAGDILELLVLPKTNHGFDTTHVEWVIESLDGKAVWNLSHDIIDDLHQNGKGNPHSDRLGNADVWRFGDMTGSRRWNPAGDAATPLAKWQSALASGRSSADAAAKEFQSTFTAEDKSSPFWIHHREDEGALPAVERDALAKQAMALAALKNAAPPPVQYAHGAQEGGIPETPYAGFHDVRVHKRGSYMKLGDVVPRGFPSVLAGDQQPSIKKGSGRLELARWLASDKHPLTSRVMVNRIWQHHFGQGIVRTPSNFGFLGERPTHPALLDYLASEFVRSGWSIKKMHRAIMLSATYRQSSQAVAGTRQADPDNLLFGRMNRRRLESEAIRDSLLFVANRLDRTMSGPAQRDFKTPRRTLYIMTIRSDRAGYGPLFDAADTSASVDRRTISTVAPQALFMMNDPFVMEQARALAKHLLSAPGDSRTRIKTAYLRLFGRSPTTAETRIGLKFLGGANHRSWTEYCHLLLCSNEFIYVD